MTRRELVALLDRVLAGDLAEADLATMLAPLYREMAVLMIDMAGFTRVMRDGGVVSALLAVRRLQRATMEAAEGVGGRVVKADADNLLCVFEGVPDAELAGRSILRQCDCSMGLGSGRILVLDDDVFGDEVNMASHLGEDVAGHGELIVSEAARRPQLGEGS